ncbi:MAG: glycosyltransferase [Myxococcota bacterium]
MSSRIRITHLITGLNTGGAEMMLYRLLSKHDRSRFHVEAVSMQPLGPLAERIRALDVPVYSLDMPRGIPDTRALVRLPLILRRARTQVVQTWMYHADLLGGVVARAVTHAALVWGIHNSTLEPGKTSRLTLATVEACARLSRYAPHKIVCCSKVAQALHERLGYDPSKMVHIPNGFDLELFQPDRAQGLAQRASLDIPSDAAVVGLFGRFDPQKDHANFVQAAAILSRKMAGVYFVLCGDGVEPQNEHLRSQIEKVGLMPRFRLLGRRSDVHSLMKTLDVLALSSAYGEAFPLVIGEAMASGIPCVSTELGDVQELIGSTGKVVPPRAPAPLAEGLFSVLNLPEAERLTLGQQARAHIEAHFSLPEITRRYEALYTSLAG